jgi:hypothetical protein
MGVGLLDRFVLAAGAMRGEDEVLVGEGDADVEGVKGGSGASIQSKIC